MNKHTGLYTDHYELTMAEGYYYAGKHNQPASFDYFFRKAPFGGSYVIFSGLNNILQLLEGLQFDKDDLEFLKGIGFREEFVEYLADFRFKGKVVAPKEGEIVFPVQPVMHVEGTLLEAQIIETMLLNVINMESLIATKANRIREVAGDRLIVDFGLRRAHGLGGIQASRAAIVGGFNGTSNVYSAKAFGIKSSGTMAHSWVQSFDDELTAFQTFADSFPDNTILLVDTYNTLRSGVPNAIKVAKKMKEKGHQIKGIRLDSGDLSYLSKKARKMLDDEGLHEVTIMASNQLDETVIQSLIKEKAPIDAFGVGTSLVTGQPDAALDGVYKLAMNNNEPVLKLSENIEKVTLPGIKQVYRYLDENNTFYADGIGTLEEDTIDHIFHPFTPEKNTSLKGFTQTTLRETVMENGEITNEPVSAEKASAYREERLKLLPEEHKRFVNPHIYKVGISEALKKTRDKLKKKHHF
ncbi:MAG: nicotinate phosphoribosyltransferase [Bacteroidota bacterium]